MLAHDEQRALLDLDTPGRRQGAGQFWSASARSGVLSSYAIRSIEMSEAKLPWLKSRVEEALHRGLTRAYETVKVDPARFLLELKTGYRLPITTYQGVYSVHPERLEEVGVDVTRAAMKIAALEGAGLGLGGLITLAPDLGILAGITLRAIQKLSL